jgi:SAM-dependent methyltransferase
LRFDAERAITTEALLFLGDLDPEAIGPSIVHATHYEPTPVGDLDALLAHVPFAFEGAAFVDVGSGMGRAVLLAARHPFRQVVGIEISPALHEIARDNLARAPQAERRCRDVRLVRADAATYRFPRGDLVAYLYNPFDADVLATVLAALAASERRNLALLYHTPVHRDVIERHPAFTLLAEEPMGVVFQKVRRSNRRTVDECHHDPS